MFVGSNYLAIVTSCQSKTSWTLLLGISDWKVRLLPVELERFSMVAASSHFGHDNYSFSRHCLQELAQDLLTDTIAIEVGGVERVEAEFPGMLARALDQS